MCRGWTRDGLSPVSTSVPFPSLQRSHGENENIIPLIVTRVTLSLDCVAARQIGISLPAATMFAKLSPVRGGREERKERNRKWNASFDEQKQRNVNWSIYIWDWKLSVSSNRIYRWKLALKGGSIIPHCRRSVLSFRRFSIVARAGRVGAIFGDLNRSRLLRRSLPSLAYRTRLINLLNRSIN